MEASSSLTLPGQASQTVKVRATLEAESAVRLRETHTEVDVFGRTFNLPAALQYTRQMYVSYVDDELLIVKDESGIPDILLRKAKPDFIAPDEGVPSTRTTTSRRRGVSRAPPGRGVAESDALDPAACGEANG